jgi:hypothetical protein
VYRVSICRKNLKRTEENVTLKWVDIYGKCEVLVSILRKALDCEIA